MKFRYCVTESVPEIVFYWCITIENAGILDAALNRKLDFCSSIRPVSNNLHIFKLYFTLSLQPVQRTQTELSFFHTCDLLYFELRYLYLRPAILAQVIMLPLNV
jgi:hypothetical protein